MLAVSENVHVRYGATYLVVLSLFTDIPLIYMLNIHNSVGESRRGVALVALGVIGQCGPFLGVRLFPDADKPQGIADALDAFGIERKKPEGAEKDKPAGDAPPEPEDEEGT